MTKKVMLAFGTRPEAIKMAPVSLALSKIDTIETRICLTGQHRDMLNPVMSFFELKAEYNIDVMRENQNLFTLTSCILDGMYDVLGDFNPDLVVVHGDTTTTFAVSLACYYRKIEVAHIEAGLRTGNKYAPWPEEMNRKMTTSLASVHFAPTDTAASNLLSENIVSNSIFVTGNTVIDSLMYVKEKIEFNIELKERVEAILPIRDFNRRLILVTGHRRENFGAGFENICSAIADIAGLYPDVDIVYPVHLNPQVQEPVRRILGKTSNVRLIPPLDYLPFVHLMSQAHLILTDSGGVQEEAPSLGVPVLVMRDTTERPEAVAAGAVRLVGANRDRIVNAVVELLEDTEKHASMCKTQNPYGDGAAAERIAAHIKAYLA
jgi:UDP-N-acetylglucosamine 2-epimerase (non-hydrolysing)